MSFPLNSPMRAEAGLVPEMLATCGLDHPCWSRWYFEKCLKDSAGICCRGGSQLSSLFGCHRGLLESSIPPCPLVWQGPQHDSDQRRAHQSLSHCVASRAVVPRRLGHQCDWLEVTESDFLFGEISLAAALGWVALLEKEIVIWGQKKSCLYLPIH